MSQNTMTPEEFSASVTPATITGFLLDVYKETAEVVTIEKSLAGYYKILDCSIISVVDHRVGVKTRRNPETHIFTIVCDDEALNRNPQKISAIDDSASPILCGNLFIVKRDSLDGNELVSLEPLDIEYLKQFILLQGTRKFPRPYPMLCQCEYC